MLKALNFLENIIENAFCSIYPTEFKDQKQFDPQIKSSSRPEFGDYQINAALSFSKVLKKPPLEISQKIINYLENDEEYSKMFKKPVIAGPGFINLTLTEDFLISELKIRLQSKRLGVKLIPQKNITKGEYTTVIDFSSPNIAKEMHVGHLRSTIIGDSLARIFEFRGHKVLRLNHVGDWGTQFGMLITYLKEIAPEALEIPDQIDLGDLVNFYREAKIKFDEDPIFQENSRLEVVNLQNGEEQSLIAWQLLCNQSRKEFEKIYKRLNVKITERGESFYNKHLKNIVNELKDLGLCVTDNGAKCVFLEGMRGKSGNQLPLIIQKSDGGYNYATTDLAALKFRFGTPPNGDGVEDILYVTDAGQSNHFESVFQVARRAKWIPGHCQVRHVPFGLVQGEDGKKLKTRSGKTIKLKDLLDESVKRARNDLEKRLIEEERTESEMFIQHVASVIGLGAIKYADLSQNRTTDYQFSYDRMLALQGNTAPYLLYAIVRIRGIARKGGSFKIDLNKLIFNQSPEQRLLRELLKFDEIVQKVEQELLPNRLCTYLFELSQQFNRFYDQIPILKSDEPYKTSRLALCRLTADTLELGLDLLGIETLERM